MGFQLYIGFSTVHIDLDFRFAGCGLSRSEILEALDEQETIVGVGKPSFSVGIHLSVLWCGIRLIPSGTML